MVADDKWMKNTVLLTTFHSKVDMSDIPFMNSVEFTFVSYDTICIQVNEKKSGRLCRVRRPEGLF